MWCSVRVLRTSSKLPPTKMHSASVHASAGLANAPQHSPAPPHRLAGRPTPSPHPHVLARAARGLPTSHTHTFILQPTTCRESTTGRRLRRLGTRRERRGRPDRGSVPEDEPLTAGRSTAARQPKMSTPTAHAARALLFIPSLACCSPTRALHGPRDKTDNRPAHAEPNKTAYLPSKTVYDRQKLPTDRPPTAHTRTAHRERQRKHRPLPSTVDLLPCGGGLPSGRTIIAHKPPPRKGRGSPSPPYRARGPHIFRP